MVLEDATLPEVRGRPVPGVEEWRLTTSGDGFSLPWCSVGIGKDKREVDRANYYGNLDSMSQ